MRQPRFLQALGIALAARYVSVAINLTANIVLARLLLPADIGLSAIGLGLIAIAHAFRDFGISSYLIAKSDLTQRDVSACMALGLVSGALLFAALLGLSGTAASFYSNAGVADLIQLLALNFLIVPYSAIVTAIMVREFRQVMLAKIDILQAAVYGVVSLCAGYAGATYMSMSLGNTCANLATLAVCIALRPRRFRYRPSLTGLSEVLYRGGNILFTNLLNSASERAPELALGRTQTLENVGLFDRAVGMVEMFRSLFVDAIGRVVFPYLSSDAANSPSEVGDRLRRLNRVVCAFGFGFFATLAPITHEVIVVVFGRNWAPSAPYATILCLGGALECATAFSRSAFMGIQDYRKMTTYVVSTRLARIGLVAIASTIGLQASAYALVVASTISLLAFAFIGRSFIQPAMWRDTALLAALLLVPMYLAAALVAGGTRVLALPDIGVVAAVAAVNGVILLFAAVSTRFWGIRELRTRTEQA